MHERADSKPAVDAKRQPASTATGPTSAAPASLLQLQHLAGNRAVAAMVGRTTAQRQAADPWASGGAGPDSGVDPKLRVQQLRLAIRIEAFPPRLEIDRAAVVAALGDLTHEDGRAIKREYKRQTNWDLGWVIIAEQEVSGDFKAPNNLSREDRKQILNLLDGTVAPTPTAPAVEGTGAMVGTAIETLGAVVGRGEEAAAITKLAGATVGERVRESSRRSDAADEAGAAGSRAVADAAAFKAALDRKNVDVAMALLRKPEAARTALATAYERHFGESLLIAVTKRLKARDVLRARALLAGDTIGADQMALMKGFEEAEQLEKDAARPALPIVQDYLKERHKQAKRKIEARVAEIAGGGEVADTAGGRAVGRQQLAAVLGRGEAGQELKQRVGASADPVMKAIVEGDPAAELGARLARRDSDGSLKPADIEEALRNLRALVPQEERKPAALEGYYLRFRASFDATNTKERTLEKVMSGQIGSYDDMLASLGVNPTDLARNRALLEGRGVLPDWQELYFALTRDPKDMPRVREILGSRTKAGVRELAAEYTAKTPGRRSLDTDLTGGEAKARAVEFLGGEAREAHAEATELLQGGEFESSATDEAARLGEEGAWLFGRLAGLERRVMENRGAFAEVRDWLGNVEHEMVETARSDAAAAKIALDRALAADPQQISEAQIQVRELRRIHFRLNHAVTAYKESTKRAFNEFVDLAVMVVSTAATLGQGGLIIMALRGTAAKIGTKLALRADDYSAEEFLGDLRGGLADLAGGAVVNKLYKPLAASWASSALESGLSKRLAGKVAAKIGPIANWEAEQQIQSVVGGLVSGQGPELMGVEAHVSAAGQMGLGATMTAGVAAARGWAGGRKGSAGAGSGDAPTGDAPKGGAPTAGSGEGPTTSGKPEADSAAAAAGNGPKAPAAESVPGIAEPPAAGGSAAGMAPGGDVAPIPQNPGSGGKKKIGTREERRKAHLAYERAKANLRKVEAEGDAAIPLMKAVAENELAEARKAFEEAHGRRPEDPPPLPDHWDTEMVIQDANPTSFREASRILESMRRADPYREVGMYRNTETGQYIVIQGRRANVTVETNLDTMDRSAPKGAGETQRWKEALDNGSDVGRWELMVHTHPSHARTGSAVPSSHFPSSAAGDFGALVQESYAGGWKPRNSEIHYTLPDGRRGKTVFGFDPRNREPYWIMPADGKTYRFASLEAYETYLKSTFPGMAFEPIPSWVPVGGGLGRYDPNAAPIVPTGEAPPAGAGRSRSGAERAR